MPRLSRRKSEASLQAEGKSSHIVPDKKIDEIFRSRRLRAKANEKV